MHYVICVIIWVLLYNWNIKQFPVGYLHSNNGNILKTDIYIHTSQHTYMYMCVRVCVCVCVQER